MNSLFLHLAAAGLALAAGAAGAQLPAVIGFGSYRVIDPASQGAAGGPGGKRIDSTLQFFGASAARAPYRAGDSLPEDDVLAGQDRSWGVTVGVEYGQLTLRGAHQNRHVTNIRLFDQTGVNFDAKNSLAAANYRLAWGTAYAAYSVSRGWGSSPLYNPDNPYSASIAGSASTDSRDMLAGVAVPLTRSTTLLASYIHKNDRELANRDANQIAVGAACMVSRRTDFYAAYSHIRRVGSTFIDSGNRTASAAINVGMRHAF
jgi:predicted porin